jgi:hypothetical protein
MGVRIFKLGTKWLPLSRTIISRELCFRVDVTTLEFSKEGHNTDISVSK